MANAVYNHYLRIHDEDQRVAVQKQKEEAQRSDQALKYGSGHLQETLELMNERTPFVREQFEG